MKQKNTLLLFLTFIIIDYHLRSQGIIEIYKKLSIEVTDLNLQQKDSLFRNKRFIAPDSDSTSTIIYELDTLDIKNNYLCIHYNYLTGQAGWAKFEFRLFKSRSKQYLIASKTAGVRVSYQQNYLNIYLVRQDGSIMPVEQNWTVNELEFFDTYTGKDFLIANDGMFCFNYEISPYEFPNGIAFTANPCYTLDPRIAEVQKKSTIKINWTDQGFIKENN